MAANNIYIQVSMNSQGAQQNVNALNQAIAQTGPTAQKTSQQATQGFQSIGVSVQSVNREFAQFTNTLASLGIGKAIAGMIQLAAEMSRAERAQAALADSAEQANEIFEQIRAIAAQSPFKFDDLEEAGQRMLVLGINAKNVTYALKIVTDQVARMGGTVNDVNTIINLFGRMIQKDAVGAMDLMRKLPALGVPVIGALRTELEKLFNHPFDTAQIKEAIKNGVLTPMQTISVMLEAMKAKGDASGFSDDAARAFKNLGDTIRETVSKLFGPDGFGPALTKLAGHISEILAPLGGLIDYLMKLDEPTKEMIINVTAAAVALSIFGPALRIVTALASPLLNLVKAMWSFTAALAAMNPELTIAVVLIGALAFAAYKLIPQFKGFVDSIAGSAMDKLKSAVKSLAEAGKQFLAPALKPGTPIDKGPLVANAEQFKEITDEMQKHADSAEKALLEALSSPLEAVAMKYEPLFRDLEQKIEKNLLDPLQAGIARGILMTAQVADQAAANFKQRKQQMDEETRYKVEHAKGAADAEVAYIEAQNAQDLRSKVNAIDYVAKRRMDMAEEIARIEKQNLTDQFNAFVKLAEAYRTEWEKAGINVDDVIQRHREETTRKQAALDIKAFDESQKYRLEGWKKANDVIIEDQKRVYEAFKDQFSQLFDVFTDKSKSLTQALGDFFKKLAVGEVREMFASRMAGVATEAAGYGRPEEGITRGGQGILGILLRRGMPPRPPLPPPEMQNLPVTESGVKSYSGEMQGSAHRFEISTDAYSVATLRFEEAVQNFAGATMSSKGSAARMADGGGGAFSGAFQSASASTGVPEPLLRAVAQAESNMNPLARSGKGAMGLMQLMPRTAAGRGVTDPYDVGQNVMGGAQELKWLMQRYHGDVPQVLAAYNMGATAYDDRRAAGRGLPTETRNYVARITRMMAASTPEDERYIRATGGAPGVSVAQLAALPTLGGGQSTAFNIPAFGGSAYTAPSVAELASLPQGASAMASLGLLGPIGAGALKAGGITTAGGVSKANLSALGQFFGIYGKGVTSPLSILTSPAAGTLAMMGGMALASKGLQQRNAPATTIGGGLAGAGAFLTSPSMIARASEMPGGAGLGLGAAAATGAGMGLFASGFQRGGGAGLAMDIGGGALAGAGIGTMILPGLGTAIGAAIGAGVGAITGIVRLFVHTQAERIRTGIKQVYGIDIANQQIIKQIQTIIDQKYGGSVTIGIRSQDVQDIVRLYALSTGQAAKLPRPMYAATIAQSQAGGLATQPVYQGGVLVQNPYTGATTYQYQTAVTAAQGLMAGSNQGVPGAGGQTSNIFMQLNPQQANDLFTGRVVQAVQQNPAAIASANSRGTRAGDSRVSQASNMLEPLTSLS